MSMICQSNCRGRIRPNQSAAAGFHPAAALGIGSAEINNTRMPGRILYRNPLIKEHHQLPLSLRVRLPALGRKPYLEQE